MLSGISSHLQLFPLDNWDMFTYVKTSKMITKDPMAELNVTSGRHFPSVIDGSHCFPTLNVMSVCQFTKLSWVRERTGLQRVSWATKKQKWKSEQVMTTAIIALR